MAKRRRLSPANPAYLEGKPPLTRFAEEPGIIPSDDRPAEKLPKRAPIADVASDASAQSALQELSGVLSHARTKGLMLEELPLDAIDMQHLVRDRLSADEEGLDALISSLRSRGQQTPIEVVRLNKSETAPRYGLISGWRRMLALTHLLQTEPNKGFDRVLARVIQPETAQDAYVAMVEENEIRVNLSHYERARIAVKALQEGVYETQKQALNSLFGNVARAKRSKIGSFMRLVEALDEVLHFPASISEKLGLALVRDMNADPDFTERLKSDLLFGERPTAEAEIDILSQALQRAQDLRERLAEIAQEESDEQASQEAPQGSETPDQAPDEPDLASTPPAPSQSVSQSAPVTASVGPSEGSPKPLARVTQKINDGLSLHYTPEKGRIELVGDGVTDELEAALRSWLAQNLGP